jgi:hypothetical protein
MDFPQKVFYSAFELPLLETHKNAIKKKQKNLPTPFSGHLPDIRACNFIFLRRPFYPVRAAGSCCCTTTPPL